jgi:integrase
MPKPRIGTLYRRKKRGPDGSMIELPTWWLKYYRDGQVFRESTGTTSQKEAERQLKLRVGEIASGTFHGLAIEKTPLEELLDDLLLDYRVNAKAVRFASNAVNNHLRPYFKGRRASMVSTADVRRYVEFRRSDDQGTRTYRGRLQEGKQIPIRPGSNATINRELALLKHAFYLGWRHTPRKVANVPYIPLLNEDNVRKGFFEHEQFLALRRALPDYMRPVLTFAYYTGCRRGEILSLLWEQVDLAERIVRLEAGTTKNDEARILPVPGPFDAALHPGRQAPAQPVGVLHGRRWGADPVLPARLADRL